MQRLSLALTLAFALSASAAEPELTELRRRAATVRANPTDFRWQSIPWFINPDAALAQAKQENRPLFVWLAGGRGLDGTPLERCCGYAACLRSGPLNEEKVVRLVAANFVPVALNNNRLPDTEGGRFIKANTKNFVQGLWVLTPEGKSLGFHYHPNQPGATFAQNNQLWVDGTIEMLESALKAAGPLTPRAVRAENPFPDRGHGLTTAGGVRLATSVIMRNRHTGSQEGPPAIDSVLLNKEEWASFAPTLGQTEWTVPEAVAKKFAPALSPYTDSIFVPQPGQVQKASISARITREANGVQVIRYAGNWDYKFDRENNPRWPVAGTTTGEAVGIYDPAKKEMRSLIWVLKGNYRKEVGGLPVPIASVVEWQSAAE